MPAAKTATVTFRIDAAIKEALRAVAEREHRSLANMVEVMIRDSCGQAGVDIRQPQGTSHRGSSR
jgi:hypothetical protein